ncbi:MAG TPA: glycosyltransferase family 2 protein [Syntrophales bacterium]|nr:glycosyltransferase family 2 protein [Syntrophales bacterium]HPC33778.1 glycosyltransferase family 2 protein [Syntrophales bacterium]HQJ31636.1 glycosyltransferase family 2 protein [Syntrophales bacterium]
MKKELIVVPAFNEGNSIRGLIESVRECYPEGDILVVDDGSTDQTAAEIIAAGARRLAHPFNLGYGVAIQTGYKYALAHGYEYLLQIDGDGQHDPRHIPEMFREIESGSCDLVIGSRFLMPGNYRVEPLKLVAIGLFRMIVACTTGQRITDPTSGYQCMNRGVFKCFTEDDFPTDYPDANVIIALHRQGFRIREVPVRMVPNAEGRSMHRGVFKVMYYFFRVFLAIFITMIAGRKRGN